MNERIEQYKQDVKRAELQASLKANPELKAEIERIISAVYAQRASVEDATSNIIELINKQDIRLTSNKAE